MTNTSAFFAVLAIAIVVEGITEYLKLMIPNLADDSKIICAITVALGVTTAVVYNADILAAVGVKTEVPYIGSVLTGILVARGSNYLYDLVGKFTDPDDNLKELKRPADETVETEHGPTADETDGGQG